MKKRGNGEGTIYKRKDGTWAGQISIGRDAHGGRIRKTVGGPTQEAVRRKKREIERQLAIGTYTDARLTVKAYLAQWLEHKRPAVLQATVKDYSYSISKYILPSLGHIQLAKLRPLEVQALVDRLAESAGARSANKCRSLLSNALKQAVRWELIPRNHVDATTPVKTTSREQVIWTPADAVKFLAEARVHRLYALFYVVMATGLRHGEALALRWDDVQSDWLRVTASKTPKGARVVGLTPDARAVLDRHREQQAAEFMKFGEGWAGPGLVFTSEVGTKLNQRNVTRLRHKLEDAAGVPRATMHDLRHLNVSLRRLLKQDQKLIADQIGHKDPAFTVRLYTHLFEEERQTAGVDLSEAFRSATPATEAN